MPRLPSVLHRGPSLPDHTDSRAATNELLADLRAGGWRGRAWARFVLCASQLSARQALLRPRALAEVTLLHAALLILTRRLRGNLLSWALAVTHLGMLGPHDGLGVANVLSLVRANLPADGPAPGPWLGLVAATCDWSDGRLARATGTETPFGTYADPLADVAFWTRYARRHEPGRALRAMPILVWGAPIITVAAESFRRGQMVEYPRPALLRLGTAVQVLIGVRAVARARGAGE